MNLLWVDINIKIALNSNHFYRPPTQDNRNCHYYSIGKFLYHLVEQNEHPLHNHLLFLSRMMKTLSSIYKSGA